MASCEEVFKRVEKKYRLDAAQRRAVEQALARHMEPDAYGRSRVTSLYFDTADHTLIERSLDKPIYKEKLRVRAYGDAGSKALMEAFAADAYANSNASAACDAGASAAATVGAGDACGRTDDGRACVRVANIAGVPVFLEIKKKFKGVVYKRRVEMSLAAAQAYLAGAGFEDACARFPLEGTEEAHLASKTYEPSSAGGSDDLSEPHSSCLPRSRQIAREIDAMRARYDQLVPSMGITCERVAWAPRAERADDLGQLRVTFDGALAFQARTGSHLPWHPILRADESIMEVKSAGALPLWLVHALAHAHAYPTSFSKYGAAYALQMEDLKGNRCA